MVSASFLLVICCPLSSRNCVIVVVFHSPDVCSLGACCSYQSLALIDGVDRELRTEYPSEMLSGYICRT
jgi:hypothetical protein